MFDRLIPEARAFFDALAANNNRDWFGAHKGEYEAVVKRPAKLFLDEVGAWLNAETGTPQVPKLYRVHRDLRFSKDKTPYSTHLHLQWSDNTSGICHMFGVSRDYVTAGVGAMAFSKPALGRWRAHVGGAAGEDVAAILAALTGAGHRLSAPELRRVPAPYEQDHPRGDLLRRKGIVLWHDLGADEQADPMAGVQAAFARLGGFRTALADSVA
jgi:uncharacterized protein (TIGR02453 family)